MLELSSIHAIVHGYVQGVFFRAFVKRKAVSLGLTGCVRNLPSGVDVEVRAEGDKNRLESLVESLKAGPPGSRVDDVKVEWSEASGRYTGFSIEMQDC